MNSKSIAGATLAAAVLISLGFALASGRSASAERYTLAPDSSVDAEALRAAIDPLFDGGDMGDTRALIVMHDGKTIAERYASGFGPDSKLLSWSVGKSVTAVLVGLMVSDGRLALDASAPVPAWGQPGDPRGAITLRELLTMSSGLDHREGGQPAAGADTNRMLFTDGAQDMASYAEGKPIADRPGSSFTYSTATSVILCDLMTRMLTDSTDPQVRRDAMMRFVEGRLKEPVGMASLTPEFDAQGTMIGGAFMHMTARDYARFGEFLRNKGRANGRQILSERWVDFMTTPSRANTGYGGQIWLNREGADGILFPGEAPASLFGAIGNQGQFVLVSPSQRLTVVRIGVATEDERKALREGMARLVRLFPGG